MFEQVGENPAARSAAVFVAIREKPLEGGGIPAPPSVRGLINLGFSPEIAVL